MSLQNQKVFTSNALKNIAIVVMFFDHFFSVFIEHDSLLGSISRIPGRVAAPIMCYLIAEGFFHTSNINKYIIRLFAFAVISHFPYDLYYHLTWWKATSVIWGLLLGLVALAVVMKEQYSPFVKIIAVGICCMLAYPADWNYIGVLWIVCFGVFHGNFKKQMIGFTLIGILLYVIPTIVRFGWPHAYEFGILLSIPLLYMYNGKQGKRSRFIKWSFYIFYPAHLIFLCILRYFVGV